MQLNFIRVSSGCGAAGAATRAARGGACPSYRPQRRPDERSSTRLRELLHVRREAARASRPAPPGRRRVRETARSGVSRSPEAHTASGMQPEAACARGRAVGRP